jgi:signal-transduction protein with cAMP-binding, CBS, and nucleotidyltransferase domain
MNDQQRLAKIVEKIHLFRDLEIKEIESLLRICTYRSFEEGERIYKRNAPSTEMLILLSGRREPLPPFPASPTPTPRRV